jgi:TRAP-type C4-dicarboxylate transport system permease large subunit
LSNCGKVLRQSRAKSGDVRESASSLARPWATSVLMPVIQAAKIDPLWFGIYMGFVVEMGLVTPPVGFNLFVIQSLTKRDLPYIAWAALPYFLAMCVAVILTWYFPEIAT